MDTPELSESQMSVSATPQSNGIMKRILLIGGSVIILAGLAFGGYFVYMAYFFSPEMVFSKMLEKMSAIKSLEQNGTVRLTASGISLPVGGTADTKKNAKDQNQTYVIDWAGKGDVNNHDNPQAQFSIQISQDDTGKQPEFQKKGESQLSILVGLEARLKDKIFYATLKKAPSIGIFDLSPFENVWVKFETNDALTKQATDTVLKRPQITEDQKKQLRDIFLKEKYFIIERGNEKLPGVNAYNIDIIVTQDGIKKYFEQVKTILNEDQLSKDERQQIDTAIADYVNPDKPLQIALWIGRNDYYLYQFKTRFDIPKTQDNPVSAAVDMTLNFQNFNSKIVVDTPQNAKKPEELLGGLFGGGMTFGSDTNSSSKSDSQTSQNSDGVIDSDHDGLTDGDETNVYHTNPFNPDTDGDGYTDSAEVLHGYNPLGPGKAPHPLPPPTPIPSSSSFSSKF